MAVQKLSDLVPDYCTHPDDLVGQVEGLRGQQTEHDAVSACLPGDDDHPFEDGPNPFMQVPYSNLRAMLQTNELSIEDERLVRRAIALLQLQQSDCRHEGGGFKPPH